jgi:AGCS family alanine or glycine:cation symporter
MAVAHIIGHEPSEKVQKVYHIIASLVVFVGAGLSAGLLWDIADVTMGFMTIINMPVILIYAKYAIRALKDYDKQKKQKKDPVFKASDIGLENTDYWK